MRWKVVSRKSPQLERYLSVWGMRKEKRRRLEKMREMRWMNECIEVAMKRATFPPFLLHLPLSLPRLSPPFLAYDCKESRSLETQGLHAAPERQRREEVNGLVSRLWSWGKRKRKRKEIR